MFIDGCWYDSKENFELIKKKIKSGINTKKNI